MTSNKPVINCCIWLVDSFERVKMHGPTNLQFYSHVNILIFRVQLSPYFGTRIWC